MVMHGRSRARMGRLTNAYHDPRPNQKPCGLACGIPYQTLPDPVPTVRNGMVLLAWCGRPYQCLPTNRSGSTSILLHYYQTLPPGLLNTHMHRGLAVEQGDRYLLVFWLTSIDEDINSEENTG